MDTITKYIKQSTTIMEILDIINALPIPDCYLCAGTIRNYIWDILSNQKTKMTDIDIVFYNPKISYEETCKIEKQLQQQYPNYRWELKNEVYMHIHNPNNKPYTSLEDAIRKFPERCTAIAMRKQGDNFECIAPYGVTDILDFIVSPTPYFLADLKRMEVYKNRIMKKNWKAKWEQIQIKYE